MRLEGGEDEYLPFAPTEKSPALLPDIFCMTVYASLRFWLAPDFI